MKLMTSLESMRSAISPCLRCNGCTYGPWPENHSFCPLFSRDNCFTFSAGGLLFLSKAILNGQLEYNQSLAELAFTCSACRACDSKCTIVRCINPDMGLSDVIRLLRYELVKRGFIPNGPIKKMFEEVKTTGTLIGNGKTLNIPKSVQSDRSDTLLLIECLHTDAQVRSVEAALGLLAKMKKRTTVFADDSCCGSTLYDFGFWDQLPALVEKNWKKIRTFGKQKLLFLNPHCQEFMTNKYATIVDEFNGFRGQHFSELLLDAFNEGKLRSKNMKKLTVSYHDPCFLGRGLGVYDAPRHVLAHLRGVELVEMKRHREQSFCCGARGLGNYFSNFDQSTAQERVNEFIETKADTLITACPYCKEIFGKVLGKKAGCVKDLAEFVAERVE